MVKDGAWRALYPFESRFMDCRGQALHYIDEGKGEPVVMVHGNPSWSFFFRRLVEALKPERRVLALDHLGMGLSDKPSDARYDYRLQSRVEDLEFFLEKAKARRNITLVVHDWGGLIGLAYACRHPETIARLIVMNTSAFLPLPGKPLPWEIKLARGPVGALAVRGLNLFSLGAVKNCVRRGPMPPAVREGYLAPYDSWDHRRAVHRFIQDIPFDETHPSHELLRWTDQNLAKLAGKPMLLLWGARDFVFDPDFFAEFKRRFPQAESHIFNDAGHYLLEDEPAAVCDLALDFLRRHPAV